MTNNLLVTYNLDTIHLPIMARNEMWRMNAWDAYPSRKACDLNRPNVEYTHHVCDDHDVFVFWR